MKKQIYPTHAKKRRDRCYVPVARPELFDTCVKRFRKEVMTAGIIGEVKARAAAVKPSERKRIKLRGAERRRRRQE